MTTKVAFLPGEAFLSGENRLDLESFRDSLVVRQRSK